MVLDVSDPKKPKKLSQSGNPVKIPGLSGQAYLDASRGNLFVANRFSDNNDDRLDPMLVINVNESGSFGKVKEFNGGENPFGVACCDPKDRVLAVAQGTMHIYPLSDPGDTFKISLEIELESGTLLEGLSTRTVAIIDNQAFLSNESGVIYVINLDKIDDSSLNPIEYLITDMESVRTIATDGINIYATEVDFEDDEIASLLVINPEALPPLSSDSDTVIEVDIDATRSDVKVLQKEFSLDPEPNSILTFEERLYIAHEFLNKLSVFRLTDPDNVARADSIDLDTSKFESSGPFGLAAARFSDVPYLYVGNLNSNNISIVDLDKEAVVATFE